MPRRPAIVVSRRHETRTERSIASGSGLVHQPPEAIQTVIALHVRLDISSDHPAAARIAAVVIGTLRRHAG
jgi:hypothetical protein